MSGKTRKSLSKKVPKLWREKVQPGEASMTNTSELITTAFRKISLKSATEEERPCDVRGSRECPKETVPRKMNGDPSHSPTFFVGNNQSKYNQTSLEGSEFPSIVFANDSNLKERPFHQEENSVLVLKTPIRESNEGLSMNRSLTMSSSSIDSGVCSPRGSKRPSFEQVNLDTPHSNFFMDHGTTKKRSMEGNLIITEKTPRKESNCSISVDGTECDKRNTRLSVSKEAFAELLEAATKLVQDVHPVKEAESASRDGNCHFLRSSLQYYKRRKSEWDARLKPRCDEQNDTAAIRKMSTGSILQRPTMSLTAAKRSWSNMASMSWSLQSSTACIICDRKRRAVDENVLPNVLIKTTMARTMQEKRRFSEVLKVS